ncbi:PAS domain S-box protein [Pelotomaculum isophthalicicum JI]|uniref:histidine kinase n=1 Tax=Pelotomaculum isophthalicicum JI TaxID=947010 RepID=A0A9X4H3P3_9FIRM|nr:PAS domain-containing sensor histidine kinase [Pelotomaculum isophthalicicum]MDF9408163.1 PAS domain S-box protein [Pelotomaculum isophthalicicum JI]
MNKEQLYTTNQQLLDIIDFLPDATLVIDRDKKVVAWNRAIEEMTGVSKADIMGKGEYAYAIPFYGESRPILIDLIFLDDLATGRKYKNLVREGNTIYGEVFIQLPFKKNEVYLWGKASPLFDSEGNLVGAIESIRDITERKQSEKDLRKITERKQMEETLRLSEERFFKAFNAGPNPLAISVIANGRLINVNNNFINLFGYSRQEVIGNTVIDLNIYVDLADRAKIIRTVMEQGVVQNLEVNFRMKSGEVLTCLFSAEIIELNGEQCLLSVINDITERKQIEKEMARLERLNLVGEMAAGIGHEIRNPMTTVRGFLQMYKRKDSFAQYKDNFDLMIEELDRANSIITEFLTLARNKPVDLKSQNLNHIVRTIFPLIQADALNTDKNIELDLVEIPDILLDEKEIRQMVLNLVRNGLEAMTAGGKLIIRTLIVNDDVVLLVRDQGGGIAPDIIEKLGTPFFTTKEYGTGLGLAVCYSIANRHNAKIEVDTGSTGTTFSVRFMQNSQE